MAYTERFVSVRLCDDPLRVDIHKAGRFSTRGGELHIWSNRYRAFDAAESGDIAVYGPGHWISADCREQIVEGSEDWTNTPIEAAA